MARTTSLKKKTEDHLEEKEQQTKSIVTHARKLRASMWAVGPGNVFFHTKKLQIPSLEPTITGFLKTIENHFCVATNKLQKL